jgi:hypothetical protein
MSQIRGDWSETTEAILDPAVILRRKKVLVEKPACE